LNHRVVSRLIATRAVLAEAGDRAEDEPWMLRGERRVVEAEPRHRTRAEVLDNDVGLVDQLAENSPAFGGLEVEREAFFVAVDTEEVRAFLADERWSPSPGVVAPAGLLDLDDTGAHVGQQHRAIGAGEHPCQINNGETG